MRTFEVNILGQRYKVRSDDGEEHIRRLADYVNEQLTDVQKSAKAVATHNVAILAALNIADSLFKVREEKERLTEEVTGRIRRILKLIRSGLAAGGRA